MGRLLIQFCNLALYLYSKFGALSPKNKEIGILKFCGCQWVCGKAEDPRDFSGLGCLLLPNRRVFLQEASWITWGVLSSPLEQPSY